MFARQPEEIVSAELRLTVGRERLTPAEFVALRDGARAFAQTPALLVRYQHTGEGHLAAGRYREAIAEFRRLDSAHPTDVRYQTAYANALLKAGLGTTARQVAQAAVTADPASALAHSTLAWVIEHDLIGR